MMSSAVRRVLRELPESFGEPQLLDAISRVGESDLDQAEHQSAVKRMHWLAASNYELRFDPSEPISQHLISPASPVESRGMEDARFVRFTKDEGEVIYYATYTAYDGTRILPQLIETSDFHTFRIATMTGPVVHHKGVAIFPRKIRDEYVALSRHDHESCFVMRSEDVRTWRNTELVFGPELAWEAVKTGNCGSPIETDEGWLVITHGVGPMRRYVLGAVLLDIDEPSKVLARLRNPLLEPTHEYSFGYVPDVVYSCGSLVHAGNLIVPFGFSDRGIGFAATRLDDLLSEMD